MRETLFVLGVLMLCGAASAQEAVLDPCRLPDDVRDEAAAIELGVFGCASDRACFEEALLLARALRSRHPREPRLARLEARVADWMESLDAEPLARLREEAERRFREAPGPEAGYLRIRMMEPRDRLPASQELLARWPTSFWAHFSMATALVSECNGGPGDPWLAHELQAAGGICPCDTDLLGDLLTRADARATGPTLALRFRDCLARATPFELARDLPALWRNEFRASRPEDHERLRARVRLDLARLEAVGSAELPAGKPVVTATGTRPPRSRQLRDLRGYWSTLQTGRELLGEDDARLASDILRRFPCDPELSAKALEGFDELERLGPEQLAEAWRLSGEIRERCPKAEGIAWWRLHALRSMTALSDAELIAEIGTSLPAWERANGSEGSTLPPHIEAARALHARRLKPERVLALVDEGIAVAARHERDERGFELLPADLLGEVRAMRARTQLGRTTLRCEALARLGRTAEARDALAQALEGLDALAELEPEESRRAEPIAQSWKARAVLARAEGNPQDGLAFLVRGLAVHPGLAAEADAVRLWAELGGSSDGWEAIASSAPAGASPWRERDEAMAPFELLDLDGRTWRSADLGDAVLVLVVWASWCGPCREELPLVQELAERLSARTDVRLLTLNADGDPGAVRPFVDRVGLRAPTLLAEGHLRQTLRVFAVPQIWIVDRERVVRRSLSGFEPGTGDRWVDEALLQIDAVAGRGAR